MVTRAPKRRRLRWTIGLLVSLFGGPLACGASGEMLPPADPSDSRAAVGRGDRPGGAAALVTPATHAVGPNSAASSPAVAGLESGSRPPATAESPPSAAVAASQIAYTLGVMSRVRGLAIRRAVSGSVLDRDAVIKRIIAKVERNLPPEALEAQAEMLAALELIPPEYDFVAGIYSILKENVAGFYDPENASMVLLDDLDEAATEETLAHELVHALQDQHYAMEPLLEYRPHDSDRVAAVQVLSEGDATSAMFELSMGSAFNVTASVLRLALTASTALSASGPDTPKLLHLALVAPYVDGFAFVQQLRRRGGWPEVDAAWRNMPTTTEQLLHLDKYDAREPAIVVSVPSFAGLGKGWTILDHDVLGEQGLRVALETWTDRTTATDAAAGWGGDRYVVARRAVPTGQSSSAVAATPGVSAEPSTESEFVAAWIIRFDTTRDAGELVRLLRQSIGSRCEERPLLGSRLWLSRADTVVLAAGPYRRDASGRRLASGPGCAGLRAWAAGLLRP